jgi:hypothetical protein
MAQPATRQQFIDYCKRRLGFPVIDINVDDDQVNDRIDDALQFFEDYHFDGVEKIYMKHRITQEDIDRRMFQMLLYSLLVCFLLMTQIRQSICLILDIN